MSQSTGSKTCVLRSPLEPPERWLPKVHRCPMFRQRHNPQVTTPARDCVNGHAPWPLVFLGETGSGKTCAALCLLDVFGKWYWVFDDWAQEVTQARVGRLQWSTGHKKTEQDVWRGIEYHKDREPKLLVIDEIGARRPTDVQIGIFSMTLDKRHGLPSLYVSNLDLAGIAETYDDRAASRLSAGTLVQFTGDLRVAAALEAEPKEAASD